MKSFATTHSIIQVKGLFSILFYTSIFVHFVTTHHDSRAAGDVTFPVYMGILSMWGVSVTISYFFGIVLGFGLAGIWISFIVDEWLRGLLMLGRWRSRIWEKKAFLPQTA